MSSGRVGSQQLWSATDEQGIAITPGPFHSRATRFYGKQFYVWSKGTLGMCGKTDPDPFVHSQNGTMTLSFGVQEVYLERIQEIRCQGNTEQ